MTTTSYKVSDSLYLVHQVVPQKTVPKVVNVETNFILAIDCSGSMGYDLPKMREQLKKKLRTLLRDGDTLSIIWFSSAGQFGVLLENEPVSSLADLQAVEQSIDRWLRPVGLTGFTDPLNEVPKLVERIKKKRPNSVSSLIFMSDGADNQARDRKEILAAVEKASASVSSTVIVEYGYYADRPLLTKMAETAGGTLLFAQDFDQYAPSLEAALQKRVLGSPRVEVKVAGDPVRGFVWSVDDSDIYTFAVDSGNVLVNGTTPDFWYLSQKSIGDTKPFSPDALASTYAALSLYAGRMDSDVVLSVLRSNGDVAFIKKYATLFGKQKISEFQEEAKSAVFTASKRLTEGFDPTKIPSDDAFTALDLLNLLVNDESARVLLAHPAFKYTKIGRPTIDSSYILTSEEQAEIDTLTAQMTSERNVKKITEITSRIAAITASKPKALQFWESDKSKEEGYSVSDLTYNEDLPNISVLVKKLGTVDISDRIPPELNKGELKKVAKAFPTKINRNYNIILDGLVGTDVLPVQMSSASWKQFQSAGIPPEAIRSVEENKKTKKTTVVFTLKALPVINRRMVKSVAARDLFEKEIALTKARLAQKVYGDYLNKLFPKKSVGLAATYGDAAAAWLKDQGITDGGFNPKTTKAPPVDYYMSKSLTIALAGYAKLPSMKEYLEMADPKTTKKMNGPGALMKVYVDEVEDFIKSDAHQKSANPSETLEKWLGEKKKDATTTVRRYLYEMAQTKMSIIIGQVWFTDLPTIDDTKMELTVDGVKYAAEVRLGEKKIDILEAHL